jgi:hypothetical protein
MLYSICQDRGLRQVDKNSTSAGACEPKIALDWDLSVRKALECLVVLN